MTASPSVASQGTANLTVVILGKNFVKNAKATFYRTGTTDMGGVLVNRTTYKASTRLEAVVSVTESAALDYFDIQVALPSGAKAIGRVLFIVTPKVADPCAMPTPFRR